MSSLGIWTSILLHHLDLCSEGAGNSGDPLWSVCFSPHLLGEYTQEGSILLYHLQNCECEQLRSLGHSIIGARRQQWRGGVWIWLWNFLVEIPPLQLPTPLRISGYHPLPALRLLLPLLAGIARKHAHRNHNSWISRQIINWGNDWAASGINHLAWPTPLCCPQSWPAASPHRLFSLLLTPGPFWVGQSLWLMELRSQVEVQVAAGRWHCLFSLCELLVFI